MNQADNGGFQCDLGVASDISAADEMDNTPTAPVYSTVSQAPPVTFQPPLVGAIPFIPTQNAMPLQTMHTSLDNLTVQPTQPNTTFVPVDAPAVKTQPAAVPVVRGVDPFADEMAKTFFSVHRFFAALWIFGVFVCLLLG
ncbi:uncharacterized protein [Montipora capricornis]|uniref:uncharacterized protein isoform X1 n=1 Tax=Montipora capricornis TaxID=246305 RepID=UPI0035F0FC6F